MAQDPLLPPVWPSSRALLGCEMNAWPENAGEKDAWVSRLQMEKESRRVLLSKVRLAAEQLRRREKVLLERLAGLARGAKVDQASRS